MSHMFPPLLPRDGLQPPVLALAAHPDDEVIGCGGMLAWHVGRGHPVTVVHMTDGAKGDPDGKFDDIASVRRAEGEQILARMGIHDLRSWGLPDGELPEHRDEVVRRLRALVEELQPRTLYSFFFTEGHRDHRLVAEAAADVADALPDECRCLLFGVNHPPAGGVLFDTTDVYETKNQALQAFSSQLAYIDLAELSRCRDRAATVNIEDPAVRYAELFADLRPGELRRARDLTDPLYRYLLEDRGKR